MALQKATKDTKTKGKYDKGERSFQLLAQVDPARIREASSWARRFFAELERRARG